MPKLIILAGAFLTALGLGLLAPVLTGVLDLWWWVFTGAALSAVRWADGAPFVIALILAAVGALALAVGVVMCHDGYVLLRREPR
jgi:hypothetical protein